MLEKGQQAHHVVPIADSDANAQATRNKLAKGFKIDLNGPENGIGLYNHAGRHSAAYNEAVAARLAAANTREEAIAILNKMKAKLREYDNAPNAPGRWAADQNKNKESKDKNE